MFCQRSEGKRKITPHDMSAEVDAESVTKRGWLWKGATGRAIVGRRTWKMRYIISTPERLEYFAAEPFDRPKGSIEWSEVKWVFQTMTTGTYALADDPKYHYFGLQFKEKNKEYVLCFRTHRAEERDSWVAHFTAMKAEMDRLQELVDDQATMLHVQLQSKGIMERFRLRLRNMVSLKKQRFVKDGMDLDLAYILPNVIAMGYPAEGREALFRNPMEQVVWFFDTYHKDRFRVYNLCSERSYSPSRFNGNFVRFPFDDHNPAPMELLLEICEDIHEFLGRSSLPELIGPSALSVPIDQLQKKPGNVVSIHCKAGKGRTGLVICCYLLYAGICRTAEEALQVFGDRRTRDGKGVQIPSQRRYIKYFEHLLTRYSGFIPTSRLIIHSITIGTTPSFDPDGGCDPYLVIKRRRADHNHRCIGQQEGAFRNPLETLLDTHITSKTKHILGVRNYELFVNFDVGECDDLQINLFDEDISLNEYMCSFWVHGGFLDPDGRLTISKSLIDDAVKDHAQKKFTEDFFLTLQYEIRPSQRLPSAPRREIPALRFQNQRSPSMSGSPVPSSKRSASPALPLDAELI